MEVRLRDDLKERRREIRFRNVFLSLLGHGDFYESIDRYRPNNEYRDIVRSLLPTYWRVIHEGVWFHCMPPIADLPFQGWKIHVSATTHNAPRILEKVAHACIEYARPFKFACDSVMLNLMNSKAWDRGHSGKFVTIYPSDDAQFTQFIRRLADDLRGFEGPYVLSDRRYGDCKVLYYRYGGIRQNTQIAVTGERIPTLITPAFSEVHDLRQPFFDPPYWAPDPWPEDSVEDSPPTLKDGRYVLANALGYSNTGGVYRATDTLTDTRVIIKEARPHTGLDGHGNDAVSLRRKEYRLLKKVQDTGLVPQPIDLFEEWEHLFLVESLVEGESIRRWVPMFSAFLKVRPSREDLTSWFSHVLTVASNLADAIAALHSRDVIFGDLSPNNVIVNPTDLSVSLVDLEGAYEVGVDQSAYVFTPGFSSKARLSRSQLHFEDDYYALGAVIHHMLWPLVGVRDIHPNITAVVLREMERDLGLPAKLTDLVLSLLGDIAQPPSGLEIISRRLRKIKDELVPVTRVTQGFSESRLTRVELESTIRGATRFILDVRDEIRTDRLFPTDPANTNPLNLAHGALGVTYALACLGESIPDGVLDWIRQRDLSPQSYPPGLYVGLSGVAWGLAQIGMLDRAVGAMRAARNHPDLFRSANVFYGVAGFGLACLHFLKLTGETSFMDDALRVGEWLLDSRVVDRERGLSWPDSDGSTFVGYACGASGISLFLLYLYLASGDMKYLDAGRKGLRFDLSYAAYYERDVLSFPEDVNNTSILLPYWMFGSCGVGTALIRFARVVADEDLLVALKSTVPDASRKYTVFPTLFRGLAGLGNFLLDCYQFSGNTEYLDKAYVTASGIMLFAVNRPQGIAFPGENHYRISTDLGAGSAGILLFLNRLLNNGPNFNFLPDHLLPPTSYPLLI